MKNTAKKPLHASKPVWKSLPILKAGYWLACIAIVIFGWSILDTPSGPGTPVKGYITGTQLMGHNFKASIIELPDGSTIRKFGVSIPVGGYVDCLLYKKKYLPTESYECP